MAVRKVKTAKKKSKKENTATRSPKKSNQMIQAAARFKNTTKKVVDDVILKLVGMKVLARAEEMTQILRKEKKKTSQKAGGRKK